MGRNLAIFDRSQHHRRRSIVDSFRFLQPSIRLRFNYYSDVPLEKYYFALVRGLASNRSERPCLAARTLLLADFAILHSVVIFVKHREVSTHTISPNFIANCRNSFVFVFWRPQRGYAVKEEGEGACVLSLVLLATKAILQGNH